MKFGVKNLFGQLRDFQEQTARLEGRIFELEDRLKALIEVERNHLLRVKNHEALTDEFIVSGRRYQDLSPDRAWKLYCDGDYDFVLIDVSRRGYAAPSLLPEALRIPWEEFPDRFLEIQTKTTPLLLISEDGTASILACDFLVRRGYFNCNNVSGGYRFWKGARVFQIKEA